MEKLFVLSALVFGIVFAAPPASIGETGTRIIGGSDAAIGAYPYQVSIRSASNWHFCGGAIINPEWIVSAAHCFSEATPAETVVITGSNFLSEGGDLYRVAQIIIHPQYNPKNMANDIALVRVQGRIRYNHLVQPIGLANAITPPGTSCIATGWGSINYPNQVAPDRLQQVGLSSIDIDVCKRSIKYEVRDTNVCTFQQYGQGTCHGDSGGPLACGKVLHGVVSFGEPCAIGYPDVYTSITAYRGWIRTHVGI